MSYQEAKEKYARLGVDVEAAMAKLRTITAFTTSPFLTIPPGAAFFTEATTTSPILPYLLREPPSTRMHISSLAPVLSATFNRVCCWIMS